MLTELFTDPTTTQFIKLIVAMLLGGILGTERAILAKQAAGTRTFGLVALGSCLFVVIGMAVNGLVPGFSNADPTRMAAAIVTGIGFLGAGLIIFRGDTLRGVTTAAGLWLAAGVGMAVGFGMFAIALFSTLLALIMFTGMWYVENKFKNWFEGRHIDHPEAA